MREPCWLQPDENWSDFPYRIHYVWWQHVPKNESQVSVGSKHVLFMLPVASTVHKTHKFTACFLLCDTCRGYSYNIRAFRSSKYSRAFSETIDLMCLFFTFLIRITLRMWPYFKWRWQVKTCLNRELMQDVERWDLAHMVIGRACNSGAI